MADPTVHSIAAPSVVTVPTLITVPITGVHITDAFAASNPGQMMLCVSCSCGTLSMRDGTGNLYVGSGTTSLNLPLTLAQANQALATLVYSIATPQTDIVNIDVWNQAGQQYSAAVAMSPFAPPVSPPPPVIVSPTGIASDPTGAVAQRIADMLSIFGVNTFSDGQDGAGVYASAAAHITALNYLCGGSGIGLLCREFANNTGTQPAFCEAVSAGVPGTKWTMCIADLPTLPVVIEAATTSVASGQWLSYVEGVNEPNNTVSFGFGPTSAADCLTAQQALYAAVHPLGIPVAAPSVADMSGSPTFVSDYVGMPMTPQVAACDLYNAHFYPNNGNPMNQMASFTAGMSTTFAGKPGMITEFNPMLYNSAATGNAATDEATAAYYTLVALIAGYHQYGIKGLIWFCLHDYDGFDPPVGLFTGFDSTQPRPVAMALRALYSLTGDQGSDRHSFTPGLLDITVTGLGTTGYYAVFQSTAGTFFILLWDEQDTLNLTKTLPVTIKFNAGPKTKIVDYSLTNPISSAPTPKQTLSKASSISLALATEVRLLQVTL